MFGITLSGVPKQLLVNAALVAILVSSPVRAQVAEGVTAGAATSALRSQLDAIIRSAQQDFDLSVFNAATEARNALDAWERVNSTLLETAFEKIDYQQRQLFLNLEKSVKQISLEGADRLAEAQQLGDTAVLLASTFPLNKRTYIHRYTPRTMIPGGVSSTVLRIFGTHLSKADLLVEDVEGNALEMIESTAATAGFVIPDELLVDRDGKPRPLQLSIQYDSSPYAWFNKGHRTDLVSPWVMPKLLATYTITPTIKTDTIERKMQTFHSGKMSGRNRTVYKGIRPPEGWRFDLDRFRDVSVRGNGGEAGRCQKIADEDRSENGVKIQARVDAIREVNWGGVSWDDGWVRCVAKMPIYRVVSGEARGEITQGSLDWFNAIHVDSPGEIKAWKVSLKTFDGRSSVFHGPGEDRFFSINADSTGLTITPKRPLEF